MNNNHKTSIWPVLLGLLLSATPVAVQAQYDYTTNADGMSITITGYTGSLGALTIPSNINGLTVTSIGADAFYDLLFLNSVILPSSVTCIGPYAFVYCNGLSVITIPGSVTTIGQGAFDGCVSLVIADFEGNAPTGDSTLFLTPNWAPLATAYYLPGATGWSNTYGGIPAAEIPFAFTTNAGAITITGYVGSGGAVVVPAAINDLPVTSIAADVFEGLTNLFSATIAGNLTNIGNGAFSGCANLTNVTFYGSAPALGSSVFAGDNNAAVYYLTGTTGWSSPFGGLPAVLWLPYNYTTNSNGVSVTITGYTGPFGAVTIPTNINGMTVTSIAAGAFAGITSLTSVTIPGSVASVGVDAFDSCYGLTSVTFENGVNSIEEGAFNWCTSLTNVVIPLSATNLGENVFITCDSLRSVTIPGALPGYNSYGSVFWYGATNTEVAVDNGSTSIGYGMFGGFTGVSVTMPPSVTSIAAYAFDGCHQLTNISISANVTNIGEYAFADCYVLTNLTIPASVTYIGTYALQSGSLASVFFAGNAPAYGSPLFIGTSATVYYLAGASGWSNSFAGVPTVLWNPQIQVGVAGFGVQSNQFGFTITGTPNIPIVVQACTNLANSAWVALQSVTLTNGSYYFSQPLQSNSSGRYFRISAP